MAGSGAAGMMTESDPTTSDDFGPDRGRQLSSEEELCLKR